MNEFDWILLAYQLDGKGGARALTKTEVEENNIQDIHWCHLHANYPETKDWLMTKSKLDPLVVEALLAEETRPRMFEVQDGSVIILRGVNFNQESDPEDMVSIRLYVNKHRIISVRKRRLKAVVSIEEALERGKGPCTTGQFIEMLIDRLAHHMEPVITLINEHTDDIEEHTLGYTDQAIRHLLINIRRQSIIFRRYLSPQRDVLSHLKFVDQDWITADNKRHIHENFDRLTRFIEDLDASRERCQIIHEEIKHTLSDQLNRNMYILSVFAAIFLPLSFITGLFGVNLSGIPLAQDQSAFGLFSFLLIIFTGLLIFIFKKLKWL